jgi:16S rRNA (guanine(966)-N(2))-methyltransferase RsmD
MLAARFGRPGTLPALKVADVFAGSGSMGLEALSRGAASCCFFERGREALAALRHNLDSLGVGPEGTICTKDAWRFSLSDLAGRPFDLVFLDPPYRDSGDSSPRGAVRRYLKRLLRATGTRPLVVLHHNARTCYQLDPEEGWCIEEQRTFGSSAITFFSP